MRTAVSVVKFVCASSSAALLLCSGAAVAQNGPAWPGQGSSATPPASATKSAAKERAKPAAAPVTLPTPAAPPPFVLIVEENVPLDPPEWDVIQLRELEARLVNAPSDERRNAVAAELEELRRLMEVDGRVLLLGRTDARGRRGPADVAVLVPAGLGGASVVAGSSVRVTPSPALFPSSALGDATLAFPSLRRFGTSSSPGYIATVIEPISTGAAARSVSDDRASPWARRTATALAESERLVVDTPLASGPVVNDRVPVTLTVRNSSTLALPPCEVFFEFMDGSGNLLHREFGWITPQRTLALEAHLPALTAGQQTMIDVPLPPDVAAQASSARVLILRAIAPMPK